MLDSHAALAIPSESYFVPQLWARHGRRFDADAFLEDLGCLARVKEWGVTPEDVRERLPANATAADGIRAVYRSYADARGKRRYGDKTPSYMQELDLLERVFPDAQYVHLVRDGRDAALSFLAMRRRPRFNLARPRGLATFASQWRLEVEGARDLGRRVPERYHELRYEDLVTEPRAELARICAFLELEFEPAMLAYHEGVDASTRQDHPLLAKPPTAGTRRWQEQMSPADVQVFEAIAGATLAQLGYERAHPHPTAGARAYAAAVDASYRARLASWKRSLAVVRRSPAWRVRQAYVRRTAGV
jgi:Sulfotransferase family